MLQLRRFLAPVVIAFGGIVVFAVATATGADPASTENQHQVTTSLTKSDVTELIKLTRKDTWQSDRLRLYDAEATPEQSIYLSAVQLVEIERNYGDSRKAVMPVEKVAERTSEQQLRNALRRLLVEIQLEHRDFKAAEVYLNKIIEESLAQP